MATLKVRNIEKSLLRKGFRKLEKKNPDHIYYGYFTQDNRKSGIFTKISHGEKEISDGLISAMAIQLKINKKDFLSFVECTLSQSNYEAIESVKILISEDKG